MCMSKQDQVDLLAVDDLQRLFAVAGQQGAKPARLEDDGQRLPKAGVVVGDQQ